MSSPQYNAQQVIQFQKALQSGQITQAQFDQAVGYEQSLPGSPTYKPATTTNQPTSALPTNPTNPVVQDNSGTWALQGSTVTPVTDSTGATTGYNITPPAQEQTQQQAPMVEPTLQNIMTNPVGVAGTVAEVLGIAFNNLPDSPLKTATDIFVGAGGEIANQGTTIKNAMGSIVGQQSTPMPFTPQNSTQQTGMTVERIGEAAAIAVAAPVIGPAIGLGVGATIGGAEISTSILTAEAIGVGFNEIPNVIKVAQGQPVNTTEAIETGFIGAAEGGVFGLILGGASKGIMSVIGKYGGEIGGRIAGEIPATSMAARAGAVGSRIGINAGLGATTNAVLSGGDPTSTLEGGAFGAGFGAIGEVGAKIGPKLPRLKIEDLSFVKPQDVSTGDAAAYGVGGKGKVLTFYSGGNPEPRVIGGYIKYDPVDYGTFSPTKQGATIDLFGSSTKLFTGTPEVGPRAYAYRDIGVNPNKNFESPFKSQVDVKVYEKSLQVTGQPQTEIDVFSQGKQLVYEVQKTNIPKSDIPKQLTIETKRDAIIGQAAVETMKSPEFAGQTEFYGSSSFKSFFPEARQGGDIDVQHFQSQEQLDSFANSLATNANRISGTNNYRVEGNNVFNEKGKLTDLHFKNDPLETLDKSSPGTNSGFGLKTKNPLTVDTVRVMDPTQLTIAKGSSALTPREFTTLTDSELTTMKTENPKAFKDIPELNNIMQYHVNTGKEIGFDHELYYGSAPANYRGKDVTDFLAQGKILNERYMGGKQTDRIDNLIDLYTKKGFTTPEKVNEAAGQITAKGNTPKIMGDFQTLLPKTERGSPTYLSPSSMLTSGNFASRTSFSNSIFGSETQQKTSPTYPRTSKSSNNISSPLSISPTIKQTTKAPNVISPSLSFSPMNQKAYPKTSLKAPQKMRAAVAPPAYFDSSPILQTTKAQQQTRAPRNTSVFKAPTYIPTTDYPNSPALTYPTYPEPKGVPSPTNPYPKSPRSKEGSSTPDFWQPGGAPSMEHGSGDFNNPKYIGQRTVKRIYTTAKAEDFW